MWPFNKEPATERDLASLYDSYDYIIVGGGTAGCVLARRLSDNGAYTVLLIEKGDAAESWLHRMGLFSNHHFSDKKHSTVYNVRDKELDREVPVISGLGLGGSTRINGCMFTCGSAGEYNAWAQEGNEGWGYQDLKPFFKKSEKWIGSEPREFHGADGPLPVSWSEHFEYKSAEEMYRASERLGFGTISDFHSPMERSFGCNKLPVTIRPNGTRATALNAYLPQGIRQSRTSHLHICIHAVGEKLQFSSSDEGVHATGIVVQRIDGKANRTISARREIVLTCGALTTPQVLMLSGIGLASHLKEKGVETVVDLPGVGNNLQDHLIITTTYYCPLKDSLWGAFTSPPTLIRELYRYAVHGTGWFKGVTVDCELFGISSLVSKDGTPLPHTKEQEDSSDPRNLPDFAVLPSGIAPQIPGATPPKDLKGLLGLSCALMRPQSYGRVLLRSTNALDEPMFETGYLSNPSDYRVLRAALRVLLALGRNMRESGYPVTPAQVLDGTSDAAVDAYIREKATSMSHFTSSCRMGPRSGAKPGVVDASLNVYGVKGLRISDASVVPVSPAAHPQAMVYAIAEKCADMILKDALQV
ncbi:hypothetical protein EIP91_009034 [Steccherinum ochraceum]|uniref:Glucose-methanol-choline oxidoreductase N-terminal domain-containing protein n=1 Tax=Steccherinum ochraceum TaxID=92696 RepID=A0A4V2MV54_9APHY|nr:hypothetical protein EIP91_009034 [Steccherinum ochraceum]